MRTTVSACVACMMLVLLFAGVFKLWSGSPPDAAATGSALRIAADQIKPGDLIFRRGGSFASRAVLTADKDSYYSHVGMIYQSERGTFVIHAVPGESFNEDELVKAEPLEAFLHESKAHAVTIRRLSNAELALEASRQAYSYVQNSVYFDADFDLDSSEKMYCTELVWRAYEAVDIDLVGSVFSQLSIPFLAGDFILPSTILNSPLLEEVLTIEQ